MIDLFIACLIVFVAGALTGGLCSMIGGRRGSE